ncbi:hypothetical protein JK165_11165 [Acetobacter okinawensis]|uniref:hypothetical protein n=1 Tax=Acetobacter okinawensis TaxID=1076594 RepID=UPI001BA9ED6B|nr:hypothetical protein [Acetobacter okinawensis]MBS0966638.1 hypothetical protein [Acetobacter okinawensis]
MTDPRIEAAAWMIGSVSDLAPGGDWEKLAPHQKTHFRRLAKAVLEAADAAAWRPMRDAPRDRTDILAKTRPDVYPEAHHRSGWNNRSVVIRHDGIVNDDFDMGWSVSAPVGYGGIPDEWFLGWQPLPTPPNATPQAAPDTISIPEVRNDRPIPGKEGADG